MTTKSHFTRRLFLEKSAAVGIGLTSSAVLGFPRGLARRQASHSPVGQTRLAASRTRGSGTGVEAAIVKNLLPAATERCYPGHFTITADGKAFGGNTTWPGLDSWQMSGAYLLLGRTRLVLDYFDFVRASHARTATSRSLCSRATRGLTTVAFAV